MRYYLLQITDRDGEEQEYYFQTLHMWAVFAHVYGAMVSRDFYGHKGLDTIKVECNQLVKKPESKTLIVI